MTSVEAKSGAERHGGSSSLIRELRPGDRSGWQGLWTAYNAFYGRSGPMALDPRITEATWSKALDVAEPVFAAVAELNGALVGLAHYLYHPSTSRLGRICYLQDLYTAEPHRGFGIGRDLMKHVAAAAMAAGCSRLYWHTMSGNAAARRLYDQIAAYGGAIMYAQELGT